jgi:hypothetical protein
MSKFSSTPHHLHAIAAEGPMAPENYKSLGVGLELVADGPQN